MQVEKDCSLNRHKIKQGGKKMAYSKPKIVAQNNKQGSYAAGCPTSNRTGHPRCCGGSCEMSA